LILLRIVVLALALVAVGFNRAFGEDCQEPADLNNLEFASQIRTLEGRLIFHDGIRQWFELKLDKPQCGQDSIQLMRFAGDVKDLQVLRGCLVKSRGPVGLSPTGYYSLDVFQDVKTIASVGTCSRQPPFPDYSGAKPDKMVHAYRVDMHVVYPGDYPVTFHVWSDGKELLPWQAYANYWLTGGFVLYGRCAKGFVVDEVFGTPHANPGHFLEPRTPNDMAMFDPMSSADAGQGDMHLGYTCIRGPL
jgi:hypothetical protein